MEIDEKLTISIILLDNEPPQSADLNWRPMGSGKYQKISLDHQNRAVYTATLPPASENDIEYYIDAVMDWMEP